jgi:hypothetical protein
MHETANNGGAVFGIDGSSPIIRSNLFVNNTTENGRGAGIAFDNNCKPVIDKNVFINNVAGLNDPMRSSDGGGISVFNWCNAIITDNLFLSNKAIAKMMAVRSSLLYGVLQKSKAISLLIQKAVMMQAHCL